MSTTVQLTESEQSRELMGRILAVVGGAVSITGTALLLSVNPKVKAVAQGGIGRIAPDTRRKVLIGAGIGGLVVLGVGLWVKEQARKKREASRG